MYARWKILSAVLNQNSQKTWWGETFLGEEQKNHWKLLTFTSTTRPAEFLLRHLFFPFLAFLGERFYCAISPNPPRKDTPSRQSATSANLLRLTVHFFFFHFRRRWVCPMTCITSSTTCGLKTSLSGSSLDKHTPWISGQAHHQVVSTRRITQQQQIRLTCRTTSCRVQLHANRKRTSKQ